MEQRVHLSERKPIGYFDGSVQVRRESIGADLHP